jgi:hypothetical protein
MYKQDHLFAIIIISEDNLFVVQCLHLMRTKYEHAFIERVFGKEDFSVLLNELQKEEFTEGYIIIDSQIRGEEMLAIYKLIERHKAFMNLNIHIGIDEEL